jgi:DNA primase
MEVFTNCSWCIRRKEEVMAIRGYESRKTDTTQYTPEHVKAIIKAIGINIGSETSNDFMCYCPFHSNRHTPSFSISKEKGAFICFNPSCGESGTLNDLVKRSLNLNEYEAIRFISSQQFESLNNFDETLNSIFEEKPDFEEFSQQTLDNLYSNITQNKDAKDYFASRGINEESINYFKLGYSENLDMVTVPVHSPDGIPVGLVGRSIKDKRFKNSNNLPRSKTMFNIHRAKRIGSQVVVVESSFDAIRVHQAGFPNVVATLGGHISPENLSLLNRYFTTITIMTDADQAGRDLGFNIANKLKGKDILWASYSYGKIYPHDAKDAGDMTDEEIVDCIRNAVSDIEYRSWIP